MHVGGSTVRIFNFVIERLFKLKTAVNETISPRITEHRRELRRDCDFSLFLSFSLSFFG